MSYFDFLLFCKFSKQPLKFYFFSLFFFGMLDLTDCKLCSPLFFSNSLTTYFFSLPLLFFLLTKYLHMLLSLQPSLFCTLILLVFTCKPRPCEIEPRLLNTFAILQFFLPDFWWDLFDSVLYQFNFYFSLFSYVCHPFPFLF